MGSTGDWAGMVGIIWVGVPLAEGLAPELELDVDDSSELELEPDIDTEDAELGAEDDEGLWRMRLKSSVAGLGWRLCTRRSAMDVIVSQLFSGASVEKTSNAAGCDRYRVDSVMKTSMMGTKRTAHRVRRPMRRFASADAMNGPSSRSLLDRRRGGRGEGGGEKADSVSEELRGGVTD